MGTLVLWLWLPCSLLEGGDKGDLTSRLEVHAGSDRATGTGRAGVACWGHLAVLNTDSHIRKAC